MGALCSTWNRYDLPGLSRGSLSRFLSYVPRSQATPTAPGAPFRRGLFLCGQYRSAATTAPLIRCCSIGAPHGRTCVLERLSQAVAVSCPIALFPATSEREKISFHQLNKVTGHRIRYQKIDADTGEEVSAEKIIKGYEISKGEYVEVTGDELDAVAIESKR